MKFSAQTTTVTTSITSTVAGLRTAATIPAVLVLIAAFLAGGFYESTYSLLAAAVWLGIALAAAFRAPPRPSPACWALVALAGWTALSAVWGPAGPALRTLPLVLLYAGALYAAEWIAPELVLRGVLAACVVVSAAALVGWIAGVGDRDRLEWPVTYTNGLGLVAVTGALLALSASNRVLLAPEARFLGRPFPSNRLLLAGPCLLAAVFTFSRSALLAGAAAGVLLLARQRRIPRRVAVAGAAAAVTGAVLLAQPLAARFAAPAPDEGDARRLIDVTGHGRAELWRVAAEAWRDAPLLGQGAGTYARELISATGDLSLPANAHSLYLETLAELGIVGLALLLAFLALTLARALAAPAAAVVVVAWAIHAGVDWDWQLPAATLPAVLAAGTLTRTARPLGLVVAPVALALGVAAGLHGVGAAVVETDVSTPDRARLAARLLPWDARPWADVDPRKACAIDSEEPVLTRGNECG
ncbi:MAG: O-antigen ligase family protein [Gaiellaceae bacterium]